MCHLSNKKSGRLFKTLTNSVIQYSEPTNDFLINPWNGRPKISPCVIMIDENSFSLEANHARDAFLRKTAVSRYYIILRPNGTQIHTNGHLE